MIVAPARRRIARGSRRGPGHMYGGHVATGNRAAIGVIRGQRRSAGSAAAMQRRRPVPRFSL